MRNQTVGSKSWCWDANTLIVRSPKVRQSNLNLGGANCELNSSLKGGQCAMAKVAELWSETLVEVTFVCPINLAPFVEHIKLPTCPLKDHPTIESYIQCDPINKLINQPSVYPSIFRNPFYHTVPSLLFSIVRLRSLLTRYLIKHRNKYCN